MFPSPRIPTADKIKVTRVGAAAIEAPVTNAHGNGRWQTATSSTQLQGMRSRTAQNKNRKQLSIFIKKKRKSKTYSLGIIPDQILFPFVRLVCSLRIWFKKKKKRRTKALSLFGNQFVICSAYNEACADLVMVSKYRKPFWLATQRDPQNDWTGWQNRVTFDVFAQAPLSDVRKTHVVSRALRHMKQTKIGAVVEHLVREKKSQKELKHKTEFLFLFSLSG